MRKYSCAFNSITALILSALFPVLSLTAVRAETLQAGVQHNLQLQPVENGLREGETFSENSLPKLNSKLIWYRIPRWLAGSWRQSENQVISDGQIRSKYCLQTGSHGAQIDRLNRIWDCKPVPFRSLSIMSDCISVGLVRTWVPVSVSKSLVVIHCTATNFAIDKKTKRIIRVTQSDNIQSYRQGRNGFIAAKADIVGYDQDGQRVSHQPIIVMSESKLIEPFAPIDKDENGLDLYKSFCEYLAEDGQRDAIPTRLPGESLSEAR